MRPEGSRDFHIALEPDSQEIVLSEPTPASAADAGVAETLLKGVRRFEPLGERIIGHPQSETASIPKHAVLPWPVSDTKGGHGAASLRGLKTLQTAPSFSVPSTALFEDVPFRTTSSPQTLSRAMNATTPRSEVA